MTCATEDLQRILERLIPNSTSLSKETLKKIGTLQKEIPPVFARYLKAHNGSENEGMCTRLQIAPNSYSPLLILPLKEALVKFQALLYPRLAAEKQLLSLINQLLGSEGVFIYVPAHLKVLKPLELVFNHSSSSESALHFSRIHLFVSRGSQIEVNLYDQSAAANFFHHRHVDIHLEPDAHLSLSHLSDISSTCHYEGILQASCKQNSELRFHKISCGAAHYVQRCEVELSQKADAKIFALYPLLKAKSELTILMNHLEPQSSSLQKVKGALGTESHLHFEGKIAIAKHAVDAMAYQLSRMLLLDETARGTASPALEILADAVKATHGATLGKLNKALLFYLTTRGVPLQEAKKLITLGFLKEDLLEFNTDVQKRAYELIEKRLQAI